MKRTHTEAARAVVEDLYRYHVNLTTLERLGKLGKSKELLCFLSMMRAIS